MNNKVYDAIDMRNSYNRGYWIGSVTGIIGTLFMCLMVGMFYVS